MALFSKEIKMLEVQKLSKLLIVRYSIAIINAVSFPPSIRCYRTINIVRCIVTPLKKYIFEYPWNLV